MKTLLLALLLLVSPAAASSSRAGFGEEIARVGLHYRDARPKLSMETCNGLVEDILRDAGTPMRGNVRSLFAQMQERGWVHRRKVPRVGDIVFFDNTYDANRNGRQDDPLSHIAVVLAVDPDGTVHMVHHGSRGITPLTMNLSQRSVRRDASGKVLNSFLGAPGYARDGKKLSGELWRAFATPEPQGRIASAQPAPVAPTSGRSAAAPPPGGLPVGLRDPALQRAWEGNALRPRHLRERTCRELWFLRNAIYASHGYAFANPESRAFFEAISTYAPEPGLSPTAAHERLTRRDRKNVAAIQEAEAASGCAD